jgi:antirestriction protein ArdC
MTDNAHREDLTKRLADAIDAFKDTECYVAWLKRQSKFHKSSLNNVALIGIQRPDASHVNSFKRWLDLGRCVRKGEKAIYIYAPMLAKIKEEEHGREYEHTTVRGFKFVPVFDVLQTDIIPGHPAPWDPSQLATPELLDDDPRAYELYGRVADVALQYVDTVTNYPDEGPKTPEGGWYAPSLKKIAVKRASGLAMLRVLLHETCHAMFDDERKKAKSFDGSFYAYEEVIVESAQYIVAQHFGFDTELTSAAYVAIWMQKEPGAFTVGLKHITRISKQLIEQLERVPQEIAA